MDISIEIRTKFNLIHEHEWTGNNSISDICKKYEISRKTYYKWKNRYIKHGIDGLKDLSRKPHHIKSKVTEEIEEAILDLRLKTFGTSRIRFRLLKRLGVSLSSRTIYKTLKKHTLNVLNCRIKKREYKRFAMKHSNDMVQMDILGPFYVRCSSTRNYIISCIDDYSRKVASKWFERKRSIDVLNVLEEWIMVNEKPRKVMHDNGKQFTSKIFKHFLDKNDIKDKPIPNSYPQLQGKVEAYITR